MLLGKSVRKGFGDAFVLVPQGLMFARGNLHISVVLHKRHDLVDQDVAADWRVVVPVITIGSLRRVDIPLVARVTLGHDLLHQFQGAGNDGAAGFP
ncbi:hypothetical protein D3C85_1480440 [compost metagenome]